MELKYELYDLILRDVRFDHIAIQALRIVQNAETPLDLINAIDEVSKGTEISGLGDIRIKAVRLYNERR